MSSSAPFDEWLQVERRTHSMIDDDNGTNHNDAVTNNNNGNAINMASSLHVPVTLANFEQCIAYMYGNHVTLSTLIDDNQYYPLLAAATFLGIDHLIVSLQRRRAAHRCIAIGLAIIK